MTDIRELLEGAVGEPPPSRLTAGPLYAAGRRRHRIRTVTTAALAALVAGVLAIGGGLLLPGGSDRSLPPGGDPTPSATPPAVPINWTGAADAGHLYLARMACPDLACPKTVVQLRGSSDGGRTWSDRGTPINWAGLAVVGPETLLASVSTGQSGTRTLSASTDGGRTWREVREGLTVDAVPSGSVAACWAGSGEPCALWAVDPVAGRMSPLRRQPDLAADPNGLLPPRADGRIWVRGTDPATGRPAVAASADEGATWSVRVFGDAPATPAELAISGSQVYAVAGDAVYRHGADNSWDRVSTVEPARTHAFVTADGTLVLCAVVPQPDGRDGCRFSATLEGLPATVYHIRRAADGWLYTHGYTDLRLFGSADGWTWSAISD